jgi:hypothetical protein
LRRAAAHRFQHKAFYRNRAYTTARLIYHPSEGYFIAAVDAKRKKSQGILNLFSLIEFKRAHNPVGDLLSKEFSFKG